MPSARRRQRPGPRRPARPRGPWKHGPIPVIGLVGGIGSGKSAVAAMLAERGAFVIDADQVGHALLNQNPVQTAVIERFGSGVLAAPTPAADGMDTSTSEIDRRALGAIVFKDPVARKALEAIVHPRMRTTFSKAIARTIRRGQATAVVLDAAVLYEAGWNTLCDHIIFVDAPRDLRLTRISTKRGWNEEILASRESAQMALEEKRDRADAIVANKDGLDALREAVERAWTLALASVPPARAVTSRADRPPAPPASPRSSSSQSTLGRPRHH